MRKGSKPHTERVYVKVNSDFDSTGYMQPKSITWADGRTFPIDAVRDFRPAGAKIATPAPSARDLSTTFTY